MNMNSNRLMMPCDRIVKLLITVVLLFTSFASAYTEKKADEVSAKALLAIKAEDIIPIDENYSSRNTGTWLMIPYSYACGSYEIVPACSNDCWDTREEDYAQCYDPFACNGMGLSLDERKEIMEVRFLCAEFSTRNYAGVTIQNVSEEDANPYYYQIVFYLNCKQIEQTSVPIIDVPACFIRGDFRYCLKWIPCPPGLEKVYQLTDNKIYFYSPADKCYLPYEYASILPIFDVREKNNNIYGTFKVAGIHDLTFSITPHCTIGGKKYILGWEKRNK